MSKQFLILLLSLVVNGLCLTNITLPHHHHGTFPHFTWNSGEEAHSQKNCCCEDENTGNTDENCRLNQTFEVVYETNKDCHCILCCASHHHPAFLQAVLLTYTYDLAALTKKEPLQQIPYIYFYRYAFVNPNLDLRAPPAITSIG
jgi:hypothetical protein